MKFYDSMVIREVFSMIEMKVMGIAFDVRTNSPIVVLNDLETRVSDLSLKLHWPELSTVVQMNRMNPGVKTYKDIMLLGKGCMNIDSVPTIEVNRCRVKGMTQDECADRIRWHQLPKKTN